MKLLNLRREALIAAILSGGENDPPCGHVGDRPARAALNASTERTRTVDAVLFGAMVRESHRYDAAYRVRRGLKPVDLLTYVRKMLPAASVSRGRRCAKRAASCRIVPPTSAAAYEKIADLIARSTFGYDAGPREGEA